MQVQYSKIIFFTYLICEDVELEVMQDDKDVIFPYESLILHLCPIPVTALLFKMEEANIASRAKAQEFIQATSQVSSVLLFLPFCSFTG